MKALFEPISEDDNELNACNSFEESRDLWAYYGAPGGRVPVVGVVPLVYNPYCIYYVNSSPTPKIPLIYSCFYRSSIVMFVLYAYFVGLFRNSPFLEIGIAIRVGNLLIFCLFQ